MPNLTISISDELKAKMDTLSEVNWSEVCRNAISAYVDQRKNPQPSIELDLRNSRLYDYGYDTGYPTMEIDLKIHNKMGSEMTIDRILSMARFVKANHYYTVGIANDLKIRQISPNSSGFGKLHFMFLKEKIIELKPVFDSTFECMIECAVFVQGFKNGFHQELRTQIPIDTWTNFVNKVVGTATETG